MFHYFVVEASSGVRWALLTSSKQSRNNGRNVQKEWRICIDDDNDNSTTKNMKYMKILEWGRHSKVICSLRCNSRIRIKREKKIIWNVCLKRTIERIFRIAARIDKYNHFYFVRWLFRAVAVAAVAVAAAAALFILFYIRYLPLLHRCRHHCKVGISQSYSTHGRGNVGFTLKYLRNTLTSYLELWLANIFGWSRLE